MSRLFTSFLDAPYSNCRRDTTPKATDSLYYNLTYAVITPPNYRNRVCIDIYYQYTLTNVTCGCYDPSFPYYDPSTYTCTTQDQLDCAAQQIKLMNTPVDPIYCPVECDSIYYTSSIDSADYPSNYYADLLLGQQKILRRLNASIQFTPQIYNPVTKNITQMPVRSKNVTGFTKDDLTSSMLLLSVYLVDLEYQFISDDPAITWDVLLGTIGFFFIIDS